MKKFLFFTVIMCMCIIGFSTNKIPLNDILPPQYMAIDDSQIYVSSGPRISVFSLKDFQLMYQYGKKGEGPGEFITMLPELGITMYIDSDKIAVTSRSRITYLTKKGKYINEIRVKNGFAHLPFNDLFVALKNRMIDKTVYVTVNLYDPKFNIIKNIYQKKHWFQQGKSINPISVRDPLFYSHNGNLYIENNDGGINIYNKSGKLIGSTKENITKVRVSEKDKKAYHLFYRTHPVYKSDYAELKHLIKFPSFFPKIKFFDVSDSKIYLFSYERRENKSKIYIFDSFGKLIKKLFVKMPDISPQEVRPVIKVKNSKIYQIIENEEDEESIDLSITEIKF